MASRFAIVSWLVAAAVFLSTPMFVDSVAPTVPHPVSFAMGFLLGGVVLYPLASRTYRRQKGADLPFWRFFPGPFAGAVVGMIIWGLLGG